MMAFACPRTGSKARRRVMSGMSTDRAYAYTTLSDIPEPVVSYYKLGTEHALRL